MPSSDYTSSSGALKLKGSAGVTKKKKKKPKSETVTQAVEKAAKEQSEPVETDDKDVVESSLATRTEAERVFEEKRRKRLEEKLAKEGSKTHKERVQELNQYLSKLSEHNDMPRIGPG